MNTNTIHSTPTTHRPEPFSARRSARRSARLPALLAARLAFTIAHAPASTKGGIGLLLVLIASSSVQVSAAFSRTLFDHLDPFGVSGLRFAIAATLMLSVVRPRLRGRSRADWTMILLYGTSIAAMNICMYRALVHLPLGVAITLEFLGPFAVAILASRRPRQAAYAVLGLIGVVVIARPSADLDLLGLLFGGLAAVSLAGYVVVAERIVPFGGGASELALAIGLAAILASPFAIAAVPSLRWSDAPILGASALLGVILAFTADFLAVRIVGARTVAILLSLDPVLAAIIGAVALGEHLDALTVTGMVCVAIAGGLSAFATGRTEPATATPQREARRRSSATMSASTANSNTASARSRPFGFARSDSPSASSASSASIGYTRSGAPRSSAPPAESRSIAPITR
ncbi:DMT family transporter [Leucobacter soli]|uniref:EamA family transporter n=1 Tax=Leucobacter soli TaxID=2812850 RepID=UPI003608FB3F